MAPDTVSPTPDPARPPHRRRSWRVRGVSLTARILAVNGIALALLAGSFFYLDSYRKQLLAERFKLARAEAEIAATALTEARPTKAREVLAEIGTAQKLRLTLYDAQGGLIADSFRLAPPPFTFADPDQEAWFTTAARLLDRGVDFVVGAPAIERYREPPETGAANWPEIARARAAHSTEVYLRYAPDRTPVITAATPVGDDGKMLLALRNAKDVTQFVRDARQSLGIIIGVAFILSIQLSLFLARTIVQPLRALVRAAVRVRLGRDRAVVVPRLPERGDEIGLLARAISDMTAALRQRIDAVESFAADVTHEIKNPLASLRSALESLEKVEDSDLCRQLTGIAAHDIRRIDRLVTEIADASRIDAELSRTTFESVDLLALAVALEGARDRRGANSGRRVLINPIGSEPPVVAGDPARLERVFENLLDNAVSFSPPEGCISITIASNDGLIITEICDEGPGIAPEAHERVFERFHSRRPENEDFGRHSGLGLAIARTIVEAHDGSLTARLPLPGQSGARLVMELPALARNRELT